MATKNSWYVSLLLILLGGSIYGQNDSINKLSFSQFLGLVKQYHPVAKQASLIPQSALANQLSSKGALDPKLFYDFRNKFYDGKNYYALSNGGFTIPTWFGLDIKAGFEQNTGVYLDPENSVPSGGLLYSQVSLPLLQGLLIDERRATIKQAKLFVALSEYDKINTLNELLYKAGKAYWDWNMSFYNLKVYENAVALSLQRLEGVKMTHTFGDRPAIDTVEASIQWQDRLLNFQQAQLDYRTKSLLLSNFLWLENDVPVELTDKTTPSDESIDTTLIFNPTIIDSLVSNHPSLKMYDFKLKQLRIEQRLKQDKFKPKLNLNYNPLFSAESMNIAYENNYKWGVSFAFPILLRKERGDVQLTKIKWENTNYERKNKNVELLNKTKASLNEFNSYKTQVTLYARNVDNYERLWDSERKLFERGESSLFMINSREMSYINAQIKLNELKNKREKAALETRYAFGLLSTF